MTIFFVKYRIGRGVFQAKNTEIPLRQFVNFEPQRGLGGLSPYEQFLQISTCGNSVKKVPVDVHRQCLLFRPVS